jgi:hypothetical protein
MLKDTLKGAAIAASVAGLFAASTLASPAAHAKAATKVVKCSGANECKGKGGCKGAGNECKGKNGCKGKGWVDMKTDKECTDKGGKVVK